MQTRIAWQSWIVILLSVIGAVVAKVQDPQSGFEVSPLLSLVLFGVSFFIPLATNQLKAIGGPPPGTTETKTTETIAAPPKPQ
jgi:hypothetical protein